MLDRNRLAGIVVASLLLAACAHGPSGPVVLRQPTVTVSALEPLVTNPDVMRFRSAVLLHNNMDAPIDLDRVDYQVTLFDQPILTSSFNQLKQAEENGDETVTLPFQIGLSSLTALTPAMLVNGNFRVTLRGTVYPAQASGLAPVAFERSLELPVPRLPELHYLGSDGVPLGPSFSVRLSIKNPNGFAVTVDKIDSYVEINGDRYHLVHSVKEPPLGAGQTQELTLVMHNSPLKMASVFGSVVSAAASGNSHYTLGGSVSLSTPYGWIYLPVSFSN